MSPDQRETRGTKGSPSSNTYEEEVRDQSHEGYAPNRNEQRNDDSTFVLDVPVLNVEELDLEVDDLKAQVALRADLANLVKINVGLDINLDKVKLAVKGIEAQALLTIRLDKVLGTLNRALEAIDKNPQILNRGAQEDVRQAGGSAGEGAAADSREAEEDLDRTPQLTEDPASRVDETTKQNGDTTGGATDEPEQAEGGPLGKTVDEADRPVQLTEDEAGHATDPEPDGSYRAKGEETTSDLADLQIEEEYIDERGRIVGRALDESGNVVEEVLDEEGNTLDLSLSEEEQDGEPEEKGGGRVDATDAARRKAYELGVKLSDVKGTGSGGRVLVKDVERAAE